MKDFVIGSLVPFTAYFVMAAFALLLIFILITVLNPKNGIKGIVSLVGIIALLFGTYAMASTERFDSIKKSSYNYLEDPTYLFGQHEGFLSFLNIFKVNVLKFISMGITTALFMLGAALVLWILMEVFNLVK